MCLYYCLGAVRALGVLLNATYPELTCGSPMAGQGQSGFKAFAEDVQMLAAWAGTTADC